MKPVSFALHRARKALRRKLSMLKKPDIDTSLSGAGTLGKMPISFFRALMAASQKSADRIFEHEFPLLMLGPTKLGKEIDWHIGAHHDIKIPWELARFQFLPALGRAYELTNDEKYAAEAAHLIHDWIVKNHYGKGIHWKVPMEAAIRACNFSLAWSFLQDAPSWKNPHFERALLTTLLEHGTFIFENLECGPGFNTNHLIADFVGLFFLGTLFPQFSEAKEWRTTGRDGLEREMEAQVYADGADYEASIPYHRFVSELFGWSALLGQENGAPFSEKFLAMLEKMFEFVTAYTKPNGLAPQFGDGDDGRLFLLENIFSWDPRDHRHLFSLASFLFPLNKIFVQNSNKTISAGFRKAGIYIMKKNDFQCAIDAGGNGQRGNGGHAHNDTLSFELSVAGEDFVIDPGTFTYTEDVVARRKFRGTQMHNTVMIDGQEINRFRPFAVFAMHNDAQPEVRAWESNEEKDLLDAAHSGYERLKNPVTHRRVFTLDKEKNSLLIEDFFEGRGRHALEWNFHFDKDVILSLSKEDGAVTAEKNGKKLAIELPQQLAQQATIREDWISPRYGIREKAPVLTIRLQAELPLPSHFRFLWKVLEA